MCANEGKSNTQKMVPYFDEEIQQNKTDATQSMQEKEEKNIVKHEIKCKKLKNKHKKTENTQTKPKKRKTYVNVCLLVGLRCGGRMGKGEGAQKMKKEVEEAVNQARENMG